MYIYIQYITIVYLLSTIYLYIYFKYSQYLIPIISVPFGSAGDEPIHLEGDDWIPRQGRRRAGDGGDGSSCYDLIVVAVQEAILGAMEPGVRIPGWAGVSG
jgi:hypothetical protein